MVKETNKIKKYLALIEKHNSFKGDTSEAQDDKIFGIRGKLGKAQDKLMELIPEDFTDSQFEKIGDKIIKFKITCKEELDNAIKKLSKYNIRYSIFT
jgi:hypothetical protein